MTAFHSVDSSDMHWSQISQSLGASWSFPVIMHVFWDVQLWTSGTDHLLAKATGNTGILLCSMEHQIKASKWVQSHNFFCTCIKKNEFYTIDVDRRLGRLRGAALKCPSLQTGIGRCLTLHPRASRASLGQGKHAALADFDLKVAEAQRQSHITNSAVQVSSSQATCSVLYSCHLGAGHRA